MSQNEPRAVVTPRTLQFAVPNFSRSIPALLHLHTGRMRIGFLDPQKTIRREEKNYLIQEKESSPWTGGNFPIGLSITNLQLR